MKVRVRVYFSDKSLVAKIRQVKNRHLSVSESSINVCLSVCVFLWRCIFSKCFKLFIENVFFVIFFFFSSFFLARRPDRGRQIGRFFLNFYIFLLSVWPPKWERDETKKKTKWRPLLAQASGLAGFVCLYFFSKGKIAKRVVWMIALAGCAQAGWIARGTRPEQGEPIYILCNLICIMCTLRHI